MIFSTTAHALETSGTSLLVFSPEGERALYDMGRERDRKTAQTLLEGADADLPMIALIRAKDEPDAPRARLVIDDEPVGDLPRALDVQVPAGWTAVMRGNPAVFPEALGGVRLSFSGLDTGPEGPTSVGDVCVEHMNDIDNEPLYGGRVMMDHSDGELGRLNLVEEWNVLNASDLPAEPDEVESTLSDKLWRNRTLADGMMYDPPQGSSAVVCFNDANGPDVGAARIYELDSRTDRELLADRRRAERERGGQPPFSVALVGGQYAGGSPTFSQTSIWREGGELHVEVPSDYAALVYGDPEAAGFTSLNLEPATRESAGAVWLDSDAARAVRLNMVEATTDGLETLSDGMARIVESEMDDPPLSQTTPIADGPVFGEESEPVAHTESPASAFPGVTPPEILALAPESRSAEDDGPTF